jgi:hypothetical protein
MSTEKGNVLLVVIVTIIGILIVTVYVWNVKYPQSVKEPISSKLFLEDDAGEASVIKADIDVKAIHETLGHIEVDSIATQ